MRCAVVDETRSLRLLRAITDDLAVLRRESAADEFRRPRPLDDLSDIDQFVAQVAAFVARR